MKHITPYKLFESKSQEIQDIEDILLELEDIGHKVYIEDFVVKSIGKPGLEIVITSEESAGAGMVRTSNKLLPLDIGDYLLRVDSYLKDLGWVGFNVHDYENHQVNVKATLKDIKSVFVKEINDFDKYLNQGGFLAAPFNTVSVSYFKNSSTNESIENENLDIDNKLSITRNFAMDFQDIFLEIEDYNYVTSKSYYNHVDEYWSDVENFNKLDYNLASISFYIATPMNYPSDSRKRAVIDKGVVTDMIDCCKRVFDMSGDNIGHTVTYREQHRHKSSFEDIEMPIDKIDTLNNKDIISISITCWSK